MARFLEMDRSSLEEFANDLDELLDDIWLLIHSPTMPMSWKNKLERIRYKLAKYTTPICCVCGESPARWTNDAWYCTKCVEVEK